MRGFNPWIAGTAIAIITQASLAQTIRYVDDNAPFGGDGQSWETAYRFLADALNVASSGDEIRISIGLFLPDHDEAHPNGTQDRTATFTIPEGVTIQGGFSRPGGGPYSTILSGDLLGNDDWPDEMSDNSRHIVTIRDAALPVVLTDLTIQGGSNVGIDESGAGLHLQNAHVNMIGCAIGYNRARRGAGISAETNSELSLVDCNLFLNQARAGSGESNFGGAVFCANSRLQIERSRLAFNSAAIGAGIYAIQSDVRIDSIIAEHNEAAAGACISSIRSDLTILRSTFRDSVAFAEYAYAGTAGGKGGALFVEGGQMNIYQSTFFSCEALGWDGAEVVGGGMFLLDTNAQLAGCLFVDCATGGYMGSGYAGGGVFVRKSAAVFSDCRFQNNHDYGEVYGSRGAGVFVDSGEVAFQNCDFIANLGNDGAALYCNGGLTTLDSCRMSSNTARIDGGAITVYPGAAIEAVNCIFDFNRAERHGSALSSYRGGTSELINCTVVNNSGSSPVYGAAVLQNSIVWNNQLPQMAEAIVTYSNIQAGASGEGNISSPPRFADPDLGDYRLLPASPGIDAGDNTALPPNILTDLAGQPRFADDTGMPDRGMGKQPITDMGAFEFQDRTCWPDFNYDQIVNILDFIAFLNSYNANDLNADYTWDGQINSQDFLTFLNAYSQGCP